MLLRLIEWHSSVVGIKDACEGVAHMREIIRSFKSQLSAFWFTRLTVTRLICQNIKLEELRLADSAVPTSSPDRLAQPFVRGPSFR